MVTELGASVCACRPNKFERIGASLAEESRNGLVLGFLASRTLCVEEAGASMENIEIYGQFVAAIVGHVP